MPKYKDTEGMNRHAYMPKYRYVESKIKEEINKKIADWVTQYISCNKFYTIVLDCRQLRSSMIFKEKQITDYDRLYIVERDKETYDIMKKTNICKNIIHGELSDFIKSTDMSTFRCMYLDFMCTPKRVQPCMMNLLTNYTSKNPFILGLTFSLRGHRGEKKPKHYSGMDANWLIKYIIPWIVSADMEIVIQKKYRHNSTGASMVTFIFVIKRIKLVGFV